MIKVVNVISDSNIGGAGKALLTFLRSYNREEFDITVVLPKGSALIPELDECGAAYYEVEGIAERSFSREGVRRLRAAFEELRPDIVHTHASLSARIAARLYDRKRCKVVHTRHSVFKVARWRRLFPFKQIQGILNNSLSDMIIAVSPAAKDNMTDTGTNPKKVRVVFNGVSALTPLSEDEIKLQKIKLGIAEDDFVCSICARVERYKGHEEILKAARLFRLYHTNVRIIITGEGSDLERIKGIAAKDQLDNVIFTGFVDDISKILGITKLQLNASWGTEATSLALLEGLSLGVPAVVSDFGGNPFVILDGVNGAVTPVKNHAAIYSAVLSIMNSEALYKQMREKSFETFYSKFTAEANAEGIMAVYKELAGIDSENA